VKIGFLNVQSGVGVTRGYWQYALRGHRYVLPNGPEIVDSLAELARTESLTVLATAEMEGGSFRTRGIDRLGLAYGAADQDHHRHSTADESDVSYGRVGGNHGAEGHRHSDRDLSVAG